MLIRQLFGRGPPVVLEIGFGMGKSLVEMAAAAPKRKIYRDWGASSGCWCLLNIVSARGRHYQLRLFCHDAVEVLGQMIPDRALIRCSCSSRSMA